MQQQYNPVLGALMTLDRSAENYHERRVKIINKYTHTNDPVIEVDSDGEDSSDEEQQLDQFDAGMTGMLTELNKETKLRASGPQGPRREEDLGLLLRQLALWHGVLRGGPSASMPPQLSDEERLLVAAVTEGDVAETTRLISVPGRQSLKLADGDTLLHLACRHPVDRVIATIARLKPDLNAANRIGRTPLQELAKSGGSLAILCSLVKLGADPWARDHMGKLAADDMTEAVRQGFEKWLAANNYHPPNTEKQPATTPVPFYSKGGKRCVCEITLETTAQQILDDLPVELAVLRPFKTNLSVVEYRRKVGDAGPKLTLLQPSQRLLELVGTWGDDPCGPNSAFRFLIVPGKGAPKELFDVYERNGFGNFAKK